MARLRDLYKSEVAPALMAKFNYKSSMQIPKFDKIVINVGAGDAKDNSKVIDSIISEISLITGQKAVPTYAKKSVANFKLREGVKIGVKVTLRGERMYEFMDRLFTFALPRVRDFKGINPNGFDGRGNYSMGLKELSCFFIVCSCCYESDIHTTDLVNLIILDFWEYELLTKTH